MTAQILALKGVVRWLVKHPKAIQVLLFTLHHCYIIHVYIT